MDPTKPSKKVCARSQSQDGIAPPVVNNISITHITLNGSTSATLLNQLQSIHPALEQLQLGSNSTTGTGAGSLRIPLNASGSGSNSAKHVGNGKSSTPSNPKPSPTKTAIPAKVVPPINPPDPAKKSATKNAPNCFKTASVESLGGRSSGSTSNKSSSPSGTSKSKGNNGSNSNNCNSSPAKSTPLPTPPRHMATPSTSMVSLAGSDILGDIDQNIVLTVNATKERAGGLLKIMSTKVVYFYSIEWSQVFNFPQQELDKYEIVNTLMALEIFAQIVRIHLRSNPDDKVRLKCCNNFYNANDKTYRGNAEIAKYKEMIETIKEKLAHQQFKGEFLLSSKKNMDMKVADKLSSTECSKVDALPIVSVQKTPAPYLSEYTAHNFSLSHLSVLHTIALYVPKSILIS